MTNYFVSTRRIGGSFIKDGTLGIGVQEGDPGLGGPVGVVNSPIGGQVVPMV